MCYAHNIVCKMRTITVHRCYTHHHHRRHHHLLLHRYRLNHRRCHRRHYRHRYHPKMNVQLLVRQAC